MVEYALTVIRQPARGKKTKRAEDLDTTKHTVFQYNEAFLRKYGEVNGHPTNAFRDYEPPSARSRLRNDAGEEVRTEKSLLINEYLVDLFVPAQGVVYDMFAGTASMALACIKTKRFYFGTEMDENVVNPAIQRIGRGWAALERGELLSSVAGCRRTIAEQVHCYSYSFFFFCCFSF